MEPPLARHVDAEDILQDAFIAAFEGTRDHQFHSESAFYAWMETIARNTLHDCRRKSYAQRRDVRRNVDGAPFASDHSGDWTALFSCTGTTPSRPLKSEEARAAVLTALARLKPAHRTLIRLRFLKEYSVAETAAEMNRTEDAIHALTRRALNEIRQYLETASHYLSRSAM